MKEWNNVKKNNIDAMDIYLVSFLFITINNDNMEFSNFEH